MDSGELFLAPDAWHDDWAPLNVREHSAEVDTRAMLRGCHASERGYDFHDVRAYLMFRMRRSCGSFGSFRTEMNKLGQISCGKLLADTPDANEVANGMISRASSLSHSHAKHSIDMEYLHPCVALSFPL